MAQSKMYVLSKTRSEDKSSLKAVDECVCVCR